MSGQQNPLKNLIDECVQAIGEAVAQFGTYSYNDKGPREVMNVGDLRNKIKALSPEDAALVLRSVAHSKGLAVDPGALCGAVVIGLQDWDELFEMPGVVDLLNDDTPELEPGDLPARYVKSAKKAKP